MKLSEQQCEPIKKGARPLSDAEVQLLLLQLPSWSLAGNEIRRKFTFKDFREAMGLVNQVAGIANEQDHHPDIMIFYNKVSLTLTTHKIGGLSKNDFILAARIDLIVDRQIAEQAA